jgi:tRNA-splicing ligase RtcB (3'-phosphate/5'-hydroxy nucleic acid ligase)
MVLRVPMPLQEFGGEGAVMPTILDSEKIPILLWCDKPDTETLAQAKNLANHPYVAHHVAIMADAHVGYGMPIGGVAATRGVVIPNAVGVDIGCGVSAVRTSLPSLDRARLKKLLGSIRRAIPLGFDHHPHPCPVSAMPALPGKSAEKDLPVVSREFDKARRQLATLGGGNHFIEIQQGETLWLMVHSGSRNLGHQVAQHYHRQATAWNAAHGGQLPSAWQLDYLPLESGIGQCYFQEMTYCKDFAAANRRAMVNTICAILAELEPATEFAEPLDVAHNYAAEEEHFGEQLVVHRKGAIRVDKGAPGIIPGSQGSCSYIVAGLGSPPSFFSCAHGAGRKLGRKQAQKLLDLRREIDHLEQQGVLHSIRHRKDLDEAAGAYKDIDQVMARQKDLVRVVTRLRPLAVVKG